MSDELKMIIEGASAGMAKVITHLETELGKVRAGKANPSMLDGISADYYGSPVPLSQVANVTAPDARTITVQPWEKNMLQIIERAIIAANIGINPQNDGNTIRLFLPRAHATPATTEEADLKVIGSRGGETILVAEDEPEVIKSLVP